MTKDRRGERRATRGWKRKEGGSPRRAGSEGRPGSPAPRGHTLLWTRTGPGGGARVRTGALRQPPPLPEAAGTGWSRLEPAAPAREPTPHKGRRRLTARGSLRGAGWVRARAAPLPQPLSRCPGRPSLSSPRPARPRPVLLCAAALAVWKPGPGPPPGAIFISKPSGLARALAVFRVLEAQWQVLASRG